MKVGFFQFKPEFGKPETNAERVKNFLSGKDFDLIVLPELSNSGYLFTHEDELKKFSECIPDGLFTNSLKEISALNSCFIVAGVCEVDNGNHYNTSVLIYPDGQVKLYRKIHLFSEEFFWFKPGNLHFEVHEIETENGEKCKVGMMICFDWIYPEAARTLALKGAQLICHPSNLVLPYCQDAMITRSLENRVFIITTNRVGKETNKGKELEFTGRSEIVNSKGSVLYRASADKEEIFITEINPEESNNKLATNYNDLFKGRRNEFYLK
jgi:predicted amidohydrolase